MATPTKQCPVCGQSFEPRRSAQQYCGRSCAMVNARAHRVSDYAAAGGRALKGRPQSPEHIQKRVESTKAKLAATRRSCVHCGEEFTPTLAAQRYCSGRCWNAVHRTRRYVQESGGRSTARVQLGRRAYEEKLQAQDGACLICGFVPNGRRLCVDHDHITGAIRGLLCYKCNSGIGHFQDDPALMRHAAEYIEHYTT